MESAEEPRGKYVIPRYRAEGDPAWYHVLHGTVPGHQIDFMYCPDVPQGRLTQTHFAHLSRLMKYIEPRDGAPYAFALGNLSRDDIQHEPGHGGLALIFALRVAGVTDHAGRAMPPYAHGVLAVDRELDYTSLLEATAVFYRRFLDTDLREDDATGSFYRAYVRTMQERPAAVDDFLHDYVADFDELPQPVRSQLGFEWEADEETLPKRITIVHADDERFENLAHAAANIAAMLYKSNIKWTSITSGREIEIPGGLSIRFIPASEASKDPRQVSPRRTASQDLRMLAGRDPKGLQVSLKDLPQEEKMLAHLLFGARPRTTETKAPRANWREALGFQKSEDGSATGNNVVPAGARPSNRPPQGLATAGASGGAAAESVDVAFDEAPTLQGALEPDPALAAVAGAAGATGAAGEAAAFDPRRSSPTKGIASAFDPRRSSPTTGVAAVHAKGALPAVVSPVAPVIGNRAATATPLLDSIPPPSLDSASAGAPMSETIPETRSRLGVWIGVIGGIAVIVAVAVAVATSGGGAGTSGESGVESGSGPGVTVPGTPSSTAGTATTGAATNTAPSPSGTTAPAGSTSEPAPSTSGVTTSGPTASVAATTGTPATATATSTAKPTGTNKKSSGGLRGPLRLPK